MRKPRRVVSIVPLALALLAAPAAWAKPKPAPASVTSQPLSFWYGEDVPSFEAELIHSALTRPDGGPIRSLIEYMQAFDNSGGARGLLRGSAPEDRERQWPGYTLLSALGAGVNATVLVDMDGDVVRRWPVFPFPAKMLPGGFVLGGGSSGREGHQEMGSLVQMSWCGTPVWQWAGPPGQEGGARWHHDFQREGNPVGYWAPGAEPLVSGGRTWLLVHHNPDRALTSHISDLFDLEDDAIVEVGPDGAVLWEWHAFEHYDEMGFDPVAREAIRTMRVGAPEGIGGGFDGSDWQHLNAISLLGPNKWYEAGDERFHPDNIIWDARSSNLIAIIARHDDPLGRWASGDIVWKVGPEYGPGTPEHGLGQIIGQHTAHMIPAGLPGHGNILVFDNGGLAGFGALLPGLPPFWPTKLRNYSRAIEFDPMTLRIVWEYTLPEPRGDDRQFFSWFISSVQRLKNGNTLVAEGANGRVFELTSDGEIVWEYISPFERPGSDFRNAVYRAYRVPASWLPASLACP